MERLLRHCSRLYRQRNLAEVPEQVKARNLVTRELLAHGDWFDEVETILTQAITRSKREFISTLQRRANGLKVAILTDFLKTEVARLERHMPWKLEVKAADGRKLVGHKSKDCPKKYGRVINALNIHYEDDFGRQQEERGRMVVQWIEVAVMGPGAVLAAMPPHAWKIIIHKGSVAHFWGTMSRINTQRNIGFVLAVEFY